MISRSTLARCARSAALIAAIFTLGTFVSTVLRSKRFSMPPAHSWFAAVGSAALMFGAVFSIFFVWNLLSAGMKQPVDDILEQETPESELLRAPLYGFVAMEFYWLVLNRTLVVFVAPEGLYGWKAEGPVTNANRRYFEPYREMIEDTEFMRDLPAIRKLASLSGGFFYQRSDITSVTPDDRRQWGMGGIAHAGHVLLRLTSGRTRKFILLGEGIPEQVRDKIVATLGAGITSMV